MSHLQTSGYHDWWNRGWSCSPHPQWTRDHAQVLEDLHECEVGQCGPAEVDVLHHWLDHHLVCHQVSFFAKIFGRTFRNIYRLVYWLSHTPTWSGVLMFIIPLLLLPLLASSYAEVNYEGAKIIQVSSYR